MSDWNLLVHDGRLRIFVEIPSLAIRLSHGAESKHAEWEPGRIINLRIHKLVGRGFA